MALFWPLFVLLQAINGAGLMLDYLLFPDFRRVRVREPLFVVGVPRSGTTFLHRLLAGDRERRGCAQRGARWGGRHWELRLMSDSAARQNTADDEVAPKYGRAARAPWRRSKPTEHRRVIVQPIPPCWMRGAKPRRAADRRDKTTKSRRDQSLPTFLLAAEDGR